MDEVKNFKKFIERNNIKKVLKVIEKKKDFERFLNLFLDNFMKFNENKIEYILKIIFNQIIKFDSDIPRYHINSIYEKLKIKNNENLYLMSRFVTIYDEFKSNKLNLLSHCFQIIKSFSEKYKNLEVYKTNFLLKKNDFDSIHLIFTDNILPYYNSFFEVKYEKFFFNRIIDCKSISAQNVHTKEMIFRLKKLFSLFGKGLIKLLKIEIITVNQFWEYEYIKRINYFRIFYNKTNNFIKSFELYYKSLCKNITEIDNLASIHQINYVDKILDSSSSVFLNEKHLDFALDKFDKNGIEVLNSQSFEIDFDIDENNYDDTPIFELEDNDYDNDSDNEIDIEDDDSIDNLFIKN